MINTSIILSAIILICAVFLLWLTLFLLRKRLRTKGELSHSFNLQLFKIQLPHAIKDEGEKTGVAGLREKIGLMEQVFGQLATIKEGNFHSWLYGKPFFSFEIAVPQIGQEAAFYCAVPRKYAASVEKVIQGIYPEAAVEPVKDYTIFHSDSAVSGALIAPRNKVLPLKTYQTLEADPLGSILNAFAKVKNDGEGLALQLVATKAPAGRNARLSKIARQLRQGKTLPAAIREADRGEMSKIIKAGNKDKKKPEEQSEEHGPVNEPLAQAVEKKAQKPLFETSIRLIAAAKDQARADALLTELSTPFNQFTNEEVNALGARKESGRSLQKIIYQYSFRVPESANAPILSSEELASILHLPNTLVGASHVASIKAKAAPAPFNLVQSGMLLGLNSYRGQDTEVRIGAEDRLRHFYIIGQTGTGKTHLMRNMIVQDIEAGNGVCFIDPHGDTAEDLLGLIPPERVKDVIYFNPGDISRPMGLNMLEYDPNFPEQKTFIINELLEIFNKLYDMKTVGGPMFEQYFRNATALVMDDPESGNTLLEINRVFVDKKFRDYKLSRTTNPLIKTFWREIAEKAGGEASLQNIVPYISSKFDSFLSNEIMRPIVAQEKSALRLREIMDEKKILLINLSKGRLGELNSALIGLILVGKILMAAFSRVDQPEKNRKEFYLYIDEFQNVTTNSIETILSEARKYRLALTIAHQFIGQLTDDIKKSVFGNVGSLCAFRVGAEDGEFLEKIFAPTFSASDLINIDNRNCYLKLLIGGQTAPAFNLKTVPGKTASADTAKVAKEYSRLTYGRDRASVEAEINEKFSALEKKPVPPTITPGVSSSL